MSVVEKLAAAGHLSDEQVERIGRNVHEFMKAAEADPVMMKAAMEKVAFAIPSWLKDPAKFPRQGFMQKALGHAYDVAPAAAGASLIGGGYGLAKSMAGAGVGAATDHVHKAKAYKMMVAGSPQLRDADPEVAQKAFNTLYKFNPDYAKDPLVAGTFVKNVIDQERLDIGTVNSLVKARREMAPRDDRGPDFFGMKAPRADDPEMDKARAGKATEEHAAADARREGEEAKTDYWRLKADKER